MKVEVLADGEQVARVGAARVAAEVRSAVSERRSCTLAVSGGTTPWRMLCLLAEEDVPWQAVHVLQVDERVAPAGHPDRNLTHLRQSLLGRVPLGGPRVHPMPVEAGDLEAAARRYAERLEGLAGLPPVIDVVQLGLGTDGHTASLVPGDGVLEVRDADVAITERPYQGRRRMTMTYPLLNRARCVVWLVTGSAKAEMLHRLGTGDETIPAGRVARDRAVVLADRAAAAWEG